MRKDKNTTNNNKLKKKNKTMKRKDYEKPAMKVVEVKIESHLLAVSTDGSVGATMENVWEEENL